MARTVYESHAPGSQRIYVALSSPSPGEYEAARVDESGTERGAVRATSPKAALSAFGEFHAPRIREALDPPWQK